MAEHSVTMERTLRKLLEEKKYATLRDILVTMNPSDIAAIFDELEEDRLPLLFRLLPKELGIKRGHQRALRRRRGRHRRGDAGHRGQKDPEPG